MMGALASGRCFSSALDAASSVYSSVVPVVSSEAGHVVQVWYSPTVSGAASGWDLYRQDVTAGGPAVVMGAPVLSFASCDQVATVLDGVSLGMCVVLVWAAAFGFASFRRVLGV